jgi:LmbE family N-acetylglucosaminyl deacetylase
LTSFSKRLLGTIAEQVWVALFAAMGVVSRPRGATWPNPDPFRRVLVIAPHPDDETIGCGGALRLHSAAGAQVVVACVTDGRTSRAFGLAPDEMARRRRLEAEAAATTLGVDRLEWLGLAGGAWTDDQLVQALERLTGAVAPDLVYAPSCVDFHPEHVQVARAVAHCWATAEITPRAVRIYPVQVPLTPVLANLVVDVTGVLPDIRVALDQYATQIANVPRALRQRRYTAARWRIGTYAEEFWELSTDAYIRLHRQPPAGAAFRGVRAHAIYDPAAYWSGARARRQLARMR